MDQDARLGADPGFRGPSLGAGRLHTPKGQLGGEVTQTHFADVVSGTDLDTTGATGSRPRIRRTSSRPSAHRGSHDRLSESNTRSRHSPRSVPMLGFVSQFVERPDQLVNFGPHLA